jgi:hypothetical protein
MREQAYRMKEAWKNTSQAERSRQKREREQQKQKEQNELHEMIMKQVQQSMQDMFKQPHQHHHSDDDSDMDKSHQLESMDNITVSECFNLSDLCQPPTKKTKTQHFAPITTAFLETRLGKSRLHKLRVLFDSGSSGSIIVAKFVKKLRFLHQRLVLVPKCRDPPTVESLVPSPFSTLLCCQCQSLPHHS